MGKLKAYYEELTESGRLEKDELAMECELPADYQKSIDNEDAMKDKATPWWEPLDQAMASDNPPYEDKP